MYKTLFPKTQRRHRMDEFGEITKQKEDRWCALAQNKTHLLSCNFLQNVHNGATYPNVFFPPKRTKTRCTETVSLQHAQKREMYRNDFPPKCTQTQCTQTVSLQNAQKRCVPKRFSSKVHKNACGYRNGFPPKSYNNAAEADGVFRTQTERTSPRKDLRSRPSQR